MNPPFAYEVDLISENFLFFEVSEEGIFLFFLRLFHFYCVTAFVRRFVVFHGVRSVYKLSYQLFTFSVCIRSDLNLDLV